MNENIILAFVSLAETIVKSGAIITIGVLVNQALSKITRFSCNLQCRDLCK